MIGAQTFRDNLRSSTKSENIMASDVEKILVEFKKMEKRFDAIDKELSIIKDDIRKISKFVPMDNADFNVHVTQKNGTNKKQKK